MTNKSGRMIIAVTTLTGRSIHAIASWEIKRDKVIAMTVCGSVVDVDAFLEINRQQLSCEKCRAVLRHGRNSDYLVVAE